MLVLLATLAWGASDPAVQCADWPTNALTDELDGAYAWVSPTACTLTEPRPAPVRLFEFRFTPVPDRLALPDYLDQAVAEVHGYAAVLSKAGPVAASDDELQSCVADHADTLQRLSVGTVAAAFDARSAWLDGEEELATRHRALVDVALARGRRLAIQTHICYSST